jgi:hypothetical protein
MKSHFYKQETNLKHKKIYSSRSQSLKPISLISEINPDI